MAAMSENKAILKGYQRGYLTKHSQKLKPIVMIGKSGSTDAVLKAVDQALEDHELIKVKFVDYKGERREISQKLAQNTKSHLIRVIGNVAILYRENKDPEKRNYRVPK